MLAADTRFAVFGRICLGEFVWANLFGQICLGEGDRGKGLTDFCLIRFWLSEFHCPASFIAQ
jgi:hypothetical protein